jgi:hypothetical protein
VTSKDQTLAALAKRAQLPAETVIDLGKRSFLQPAYAQQVKERVKMAEETLAQRDFLSRMPGVDVDVDEINKGLERDRRTLEMGTPPAFDRPTKNRLFKLMQLIEQDAKHDMPTHDDMERPIAGNIDRHIAWSDVHKTPALLWKNIRRALDPGNDSPNFTNVEIWRSNTPPKGDPRKYFRGFDQIQWAAEIEEEVAASISDADYLCFLELRVMQWAPANIQRELGWDKAQYEAALERFRRSRRGTDADADAARLEAPARPRRQPAPDPDEDEDEENGNGNGSEDDDDTGDASDEPKATIPIPQPQKITFDSSNVWPAPQMREAGLSVAMMEKLSTVARVKIYAVCTGRGKFSEGDRSAMQRALAEWNETRAFMGTAARGGG